MEKNCCEKLLQILLQENADEVICGMKIFKNNVLLRTPHLNNKVINFKEEFSNFEYISKLLASPCNKLYKRELIIKNFKNDISVGEDLLFNLDYLLHVNKIVTIEDCLYKVFLDNENSLNRKYREDRLNEEFLVLDEQIKICETIYVENINYNFLYESYVLLYHAYIMNMLKKCNRKKEKEIIKFYANDKKIEKATTHCKFKRKYYKLFNYLVKNKKYTSIYVLIKIRECILNLLKI